MSTSDSPSMSTSDSPFDSWKNPTFYVAETSFFGEKFYCGYATDFPEREKEESDRHHKWCPDILKARTTGIVYRKMQLGRFYDKPGEPLRRQARKRELVHSFQLIKKHGRQNCNGAIWLYGPTLLENKPQVRSRVLDELSVAKFFFCMLKDDCAFAESNTKEYEALSNACEDWAKMDTNIRDFLDGTGKWRPRNDPTRKRSREEE